MKRAAGLRDVTNAAIAGGGAGHVIKRRSQAEKQALNQAPNANQLNANALNITLVDEDTRVCNPQEALNYADSIYSHLFMVENTKPHLKVSNPEYLSGQPEISTRMRSILLDWLVEVHYKFKLCGETLFLCINLIDRYLNLDSPKTSRKRLQLVGGTCLLIASKYEEFRPPEVGDIVYIMDSAYSRDDILEMEVSILNKLEFQLTIPSPLQFLEKYRGSMGVSRQEDHWYLAQFLLESTLLDVKFLKYKSSALAASSLYLANRIRKLPAPWPSQLVKSSCGMDELTLVKPLAKEIFEFIPQVKTKSLFKKYSMEKYRQVAGSIPNQ